MKKIKHTSQVFILLMLFISAISYQAEMNMSQSIMVMNGWIRLTPPVATNSAAYFSLHNSSSKDVTVVSVRTPIAETASMHDVIIEKNMARMVHLKDILIPAGKMITFKPGGKHLMLINLSEKLKNDQQVKVVFTLKTGEEINTIMKVMSESNRSSSAHEH